MTTRSARHRDGIARLGEWVLTRTDVRDLREISLGVRLCENPRPCFEWPQHERVVE